MRLQLQGSLLLSALPSLQINRRLTSQYCSSNSYSLQNKHKNQKVKAQELQALSNAKYFSFCWKIQILSKEILSKLWHFCNQPYQEGNVSIARLFMVVQRIQRQQSWRFGSCEKESCVDTGHYFRDMKAKIKQNSKLSLKSYHTFTESKNTISIHLKKCLSYRHWIITYY